MAIEYLDGGRITGLSTDAKPDRDTSDATIPALTVEAGSVFIETDTGSKYVHNGTAWIQQPFDSITSALGRNDGVIQRQWFQEWFTGHSLNTDIWLATTIYTAPTFQMGDSVNGGFEIVTAATNNTGGVIDFSDNRQFSNISSAMIFVGKRDGNGDVIGGLTYTEREFSTWLDTAFVRNMNGEANCFFNTSNASNDQQTNLATAPTTNTLAVKIELKPASANATINGVLEATNSTYLPSATAGLQPLLGFRTTSATALTGRFTYCEAYNT